MKKLFGTDGIRGVAGVFPLDVNTVKLIGYSLAKEYREALGRVPRFITGRDTRESGSELEKALQAGVLAAGAECVSANVMTTPGIAFLTKFGEFDAGIVLSASHNPFQDNGIKIFQPSGKKSGSELEAAIERDVLSGNLHLDNVEVAADFSRADELKQAYIQHLGDTFANLKLDGLKIVIDCANGAASDIAPELFAKFGGDIAIINNSPDGRNINENCGSLHLDLLREKVLQTNADFGVAFDGDADRALFVDELGNIVDGDATLWILATFLQEHGKLPNNKIIATVMSNIGLEIALRGLGLELVRADVGDKYVLEELLKSEAAIGGEQSGHIIFPKQSLVGDGMMTALYILQALKHRKLKFSQMLDGFRQFPQTLVNVKVSEKKPFDNVAAIAKVVEEVENQLAGNGRLLLRYSGTENLARIMIEGEHQEAIESQAQHIAKVIQNELG